MTALDSYLIDLNTSEAEAEISSNIVENTKQLPVVVHRPRLNSKIILQNMEEVLDKVKKQHKKKHRRKKELKKLALMEAASRTETVSSAESKDKKKKQYEKKYKQERGKNLLKKPLQEKSTVENGKILQVSPVKSGTILQHFPRTPKKEEYAIVQDEVVVITQNEIENIKKVPTPLKNSTITNAFEVMMNARNHSIGSNTPGKNVPSPVIDNELSVTNAKRKLKLQEWSDQKGGVKRKLEEEARAEYVDDQLMQRAKRFKQMLVSGAIAKPENKTNIDNNKFVNKAYKNKPKKRGGPRTRRLSSVGSEDSFDQLISAKVDAETSEFLAKLNSPTKKRDSLLGYFPKKESPKKIDFKKTEGNATKQDEVINTNTPKNRAKTVLSNNYNSPADSNYQLPVNIEGEIGISSRPRRACVNKPKYGYNLVDGPSIAVKLVKKNKARKTAKHRVNTKSSKDSQEPECVEIIILDDNTNMSGRVTPKKLAPLFVRSLPRPSPDPEIIKARRAFLESGVPEKLRLEQEKQKHYQQNFEEATEIFPKISHVKQLNKKELIFHKQILKCSLKLERKKCPELPSSPTKKSKARCDKRQSVVGSLVDCFICDFQLQKNKCQDFCLNKISLPSLENKRAIIKSWKTEFERFPTYKCYNQMREKYRYCSAIDTTQDTEQVSESFMVTRQTRRSLEIQKNNGTDYSDEEYKPPATAPNGELLFSEKYKPLLFEQVLVNLNPVTQLKEFLSNWSNSSAGSAKNSQNLDDSMDLNDASCSNQGSSSNAVVLMGPVSSGKTNAVFALANEMNFNVLEINAGMKRTGKRLLQELQEATQSHQIRKDAAGSGSSQKSLLKMSLNGLKSKLKKHNFNLNQFDSQNTDFNSLDLQHSARKCLILIEDADIVFEQTDAGFTDAIYSLVASSKRPVIIVASNPNCSHLQRLISQNTIYFSSPNVLNISRFLAVLSLIENCPVHLDDLISLYLYNHRDLRKTLLELQFFIQSGGDRQCQLLKEQNLEMNGIGNPNYISSPHKRQYSVDEQYEVCDNAQIEINNISAISRTQVYMHRSLFEYYTVCQNSKCRIPFPIDFQLLCVNLNDILQVSRKLKENMNTSTHENTAKITATKRKSKSPTKQCLKTVRASTLQTPLDNLCLFYENVSIAALMDKQDSGFRFQNKQKPSIIDRLKPNISETISHCLLEKSIEVNLDAALCPYNLFDTSKKTVSLYEEIGSIQLRSNRARFLDYEPYLRSICRSEKKRSTLERRSTRFYHYLRNYSINMCNFSTTRFDNACEAFQSFDAKEN